MASRSNMSSSTVSAMTSATTGLVLPPPPPRMPVLSQPQDVIPTRSVQGSAPVLASNDEILTLFGSVQEQMRQQQEINQKTD